MTQSRADELLVKSGLLTLARIGQMGAQIFMGLVIPKLVSPTQYGLWRSLLLITQFSAFVNIGSYNTMGVKIPLYEGKGDANEKERIKNNTFYYNIIGSTILALGLITSTLFLDSEFNNFYKVGFFLFSGITFFSNIADFYLQLSRAEKLFSLISKLTILQALINAIISGTLLFYFNEVLFLGLGMILSNIIVIFLASRELGLPKYFQVSFYKILEIIKYGFPLLLSGLLFELIRSLDQLFIVKYLNAEQMGYYGLAISIQRIGFLVPGVLGSIMMPYIYEEFGRSNDIFKVSKFFDRGLRLISLLSAFLFAALYTQIHLLINYFLTQYIPALPILNILILGMFSLALLGLPEVLAAITGKIPTIIKWQLLIVLLAAILFYFVLQSGYGIQQVALSTVSIYAIYVIGTLVIIYNTFCQNGLEIMRKIIILCFPYFYLMLCLFGIESYFPKLGNGFLDDFLLSALKLFILLFLYLPVIIYYDKKLKFLDVIMRKLKSFF